MKKFKLWINPFEKYSAARLVILGIAFYLIGSLLANFFKTRFDNFLHVTPVEQIEVWQPFTDNLIIIVCLFVVLFILGKYLNSKTRGIDILATTLISNAPFYLMSLTNINDFSLKATNELLSISPNSAFNLSIFSIVYLIIISIVSIVILVWSIALFYNGFKTAAHAKGTKSILLFMLSLIIVIVITLYIPLIQ